MIAPDVGGGFGSKLNVYAEEALALALARRLGRPVKWIEERSEGYLGDDPRPRRRSRRSSSRRRRTGKITAVRAKLIAAMGAYLQLVTPGIPLLGAWLYGGCYDIAGLRLRVHGVFTNTTPTDAYRGAGRPGGDLRHRARGRRARAEARQGPGRAAAAELHPRVPGARSRPG